MKVYNYTLSDAEAGTCPFADEFGHDHWVAYHGTSNHAEAQIESKGILWQDELYSKSEISAVVDIFDRLHWYGGSKAALGCLSRLRRQTFKTPMNEIESPFF